MDQDVSVLAAEVKGLAASMRAIVWEVTGHATEHQHSKYVGAWLGWQHKTSEFRLQVLKIRPSEIKCSLG